MIWNYITTALRNMAKNRLYSLINIGGLALGLAAAGADVFVHYGRSAAPAEDTAAKAEALGVRAAVGSVDLSVPQDSARVVDLAEQALGPVSLLVNSASGFPENTIEDVGFDAECQQSD